MEEAQKDLGNDIDPETGDFVTKEQEKKTLMSFHPFEEDWQNKPDSRTIYDSMREEYEQSPTEVKFLSGVCDGTVLGVYERLYAESKLGENFYKPRPLHEQSLSAGSVFDSSSGESVFDIDKHFNGYHFSNHNRAMEILRDLRSSVDITQMVDINNDEAVYNRIESDPSFNEVFERADIASVEQFATSLVVFIKDESWEKYNQKQGADENSRAGAFYSISGSVIYAPESMKDEPEYMIPALKHEYQHLIDYSMQKNLFKDGKMQTETSDRVLLNLKSEISAYLAYFEEEGKDPYELLPIIADYLKDYPYLYGEEEDANKCDRFLDLIKKTEPLIKGLIKEAGLPEDDPKYVSLFLKTFLSALPERPIVFRMLEKASETGLYQAGVNSETDRLKDEETAREGKFKELEEKYNKLLELAKDQKMVVIYRAEGSHNFKSPMERMGVSAGLTGLWYGTTPEKALFYYNDIKGRPDTPKLYALIVPQSQVEEIQDPADKYHQQVNYPVPASMSRIEINAPEDAPEPTLENYMHQFDFVREYKELKARLNNK